MQNKRAIKWSVQPDRSRSRGERKRGVEPIVAVVCVCVIDIQAQLIGTRLIVCTYFIMGYCCVSRTSILPCTWPKQLSRPVSFEAAAQLNAIRFFPFPSPSLLLAWFLSFAFVLRWRASERARSLSLVAHRDNDDEWTMYVFSRLPMVLQLHFTFKLVGIGLNNQMAITGSLISLEMRIPISVQQNIINFTVLALADDIVIVFCAITHTLAYPYVAIHCLSRVHLMRIISSFQLSSPF